MKLTRAEIAALQRAEQYRGAAKRAIDNDDTEAAVMNNLQAALDLGAEKSDPSEEIPF